MSEPVADPSQDPRLPDVGRPAHDDLSLLLAEAADAILAARPFGIAGSRSGHAPFAAWLVRTLRPNILADADVADGGFYAASCEAVRSFGLSTHCFGVIGPAAGGTVRDGEAIERFRTWHDRRFAGFSRLLEPGPVPAPDVLDDGTSQLLQLAAPGDGRDMASLYESWSPKLAPEGVVLVRGLNGGTEDPNLRRWWRDIRRRHPAFAFLHDRGLGVLAPKGVPAALEPLFASAARPDRRRRLREWFVLLGCCRDGQPGPAAGGNDTAIDGANGEPRQDQHRQDRHRQDRLRDELAWTKADRYRLEAALERADAAAAAAKKEAGALLRALEAAKDAERRAHLDAEASRSHREQRDRDERARAEAERAREQALRDALLRRERDARTTEAALRDALARADGELVRLRNSRSWRLTRPLRTLSGLSRGGGDATAPPPIAASPLPAEAEDGPFPSPAPQPEAPSGDAAIAPAPETTARHPAAATGTAEAATEAATAPDAADPPPAGSWRPVRRVLFVSGEPRTPGTVYRVARNAAACRAAGYEAEEAELPAVGPDSLGRADLVVLWRAEWSAHVSNMIELAHRMGIRVCFDADDLIMNPEMATESLIDGIRTTSASEEESRNYFARIRRTLSSCDLCTVTTEELARQAIAVHPVVRVVPNSFDAAAETAAGLAARTRTEAGGDGWLRLGYAGGTRTHQKDFASIAAVLARVLEARPETLLVLFRDGNSGEGLVLLHEFPVLIPFADRIEWRNMVPLSALPAEMARFDVSLCPLERDNPFCESKSELKYFESALANVPLVATPTGPFRRAIRNGETGFLPEDDADWERTLLLLLDDPELRRRVARDARHDVLWRFGPRRQAELWDALITELNGGAEAARRWELRLHRGGYAGSPSPAVPEGELLFDFDRLGQAEVTIGITSFNYAHHLPAALDAARKQTLERLDLVVVDDGSTDGSVELLLDWAATERLRFNRLRILRTSSNAGLGGARNLMFAEAATPHVMVLDADNALAPEACAHLLAALRADPLAAFSYPTIRQFRDGNGAALDATTGALPFDPARLQSGNYVDAMAMVARWAWAAAGGYYARRDAMAWEDFSLWCRLAELGQYGIWVPEELGFYRVHDGSMTNAVTERDAHKARVVALVEERHPWLRLSMRQARQRR